MNGAHTFATAAEHVNVNSGIAGPVTGRTIGVFTDTARQDQKTAVKTYRTGLTFGALPRSKTGAADNNKRRRISNHSVTSIGRNSQKISEIELESVAPRLFFIIFNQQELKENRQSARSIVM